MVETLTFAQFADRYCGRQESTPEGLRETLQKQKVRFEPAGWMLLECQMMNSSRMGSYVILPYGPQNTFKQPPEGPVSPRGLASDMSVVVAVLPAEAL